jgi:pyruvate dehydrogenase (quinone)
LTGLSYHNLIGSYTQQDVELDKLSTDVAIYDARIMAPTHVENVVGLACRSVPR